DRGSGRREGAGGKPDGRRVGDLRSSVCGIDGGSRGKRDVCRPFLRGGGHHRGMGNWREGVAGGWSGLPGLRSTEKKTEECGSAAPSSRFRDWGACAGERVTLHAGIYQASFPRLGILEL